MAENPNITELDSEYNPKSDSKIEVNGQLPGGGGTTYWTEDADGNLVPVDGQALSVDALNNADLANASSGQVPQAQGDGTLAMSSVGGGVRGPTRTIWNDGGTYKALDETGTVVHTGSDFTSFLETVDGNIGSGTVNLLPGTYRVTDTIQIDSTPLVIRGPRSAVLQAATDSWETSTDIMMAMRSDNQHLRGISVDANNSEAGVRAGIGIWVNAPTRNKSIIDCYFTGGFQNAAHVKHDGGSHFIFSNNVLDDTSNSNSRGLMMTEVDYAVVANNWSYNINANDISVYNFSSNISVVGNVCDKASSRGHNCIGISPGENIAIVGNIAKGATEADEGGIEVENKHSDNISQNIAIVGNTVTNCNWGIYTRKENSNVGSGPHDVLIAANTIRGCSVAHKHEEDGSNIRLAHNLLQDNTTDYDIASAVEVYVDGLLKTPLGGTAPDATLHDRGDVIEDSDNPGSLYYVYDPTTSSGASQIGT